MAGLCSIIIGNFRKLEKMSRFSKRSEIENIFLLNQRDGTHMAGTITVMASPYFLLRERFFGKILHAPDFDDCGNNNQYHYLITNVPSR